MKITNPKITISYNRFLDPIFIEYTKSTVKEYTIPNISTVHKNILMYKKEWAKYEYKILHALQKITGLHFKRNRIDIHVVSVNGRSFSSPIVVKSRYSKIDFINIVTHELIHSLYSDNSDLVNNHIIDPEFKKSVSIKTAHHVVLHAILKYIYMDVLKEPKRLKADIKFCKSKDYSEAWQIVEQCGYKDLIKRFKSRFQKPNNN